MQTQLSGDQLVERLNIRSELEEIAQGAAARDAERILPLREVRMLADKKIGAVRLPSELGGFGIDLAELLALVEEIAVADSNVAHAFRNNYFFVEQMMQSPKGNFNWNLLPRVVAGELVGSATSELTTKHAGAAAQMDYSTTLSEIDGSFFLNGTKFYSTGNVYAQTLVVSAVRENGKPVTVVIPADRAGVDLTDDWDGIGQRLTGSGSTVFDDVVVHPEEIAPLGDLELTYTQYHATLAQLYLTVIQAGVIRNALADVVTIVRNRGRNYYHGLTDLPRDDAAVQQTVGQVSANSFALSSVARAAARRLGDAWVPGLSGDEREPLLLEAALDAARAKVVADELSARTATLLYDVGGASTVSTRHGLDRHWRNVRTLAAHNPSSYKSRFIGQYELNKVPPPAGSFF